MYCICFTEKKFYVERSEENALLSDIEIFILN